MIFTLEKIRRNDTVGGFFFYVVPGRVMRDFLINFKTGDFYQKLKGLMQAIFGNAGTLYYPFHWMTTKKQFNDTTIYDWTLHNEIVRWAPQGASVMYAVCCVTAPRTFLSFFSPFLFFS
jgi:hypothetical protein